MAPTNVRRSRLAFIYAVPIAVLGGLIGLGGAEFRLPVLAGPLRYNTRQAVPLNLTISLITLATALLVRNRTLSLAPLGPFAPVILAMIAGAMLSAFFGAELARRFSDERLEQVILVLLLAIGCALIVEAFLPRETPALLPDATGWRVGAGVLFGLIIGLVSSLLGVAGGELIIPTLIFAFGAGIKTAGTASLLISLPTVSIGLVRFARLGAFRDSRPLVETVAPMGVGSVIGAILGGILAGIAPVALLKFGLGVILIVSAWRTFRGLRGGH